MLGSTAFVFGEDSQIRRARRIRISLQERKVEKPITNWEKIKQFFISNVYITFLTIYIFWTSVGIVFYTFYNNWTPATAFFYAMQAGLSIGFCNPLERDDWSKLFTIFYVIIGSMIIAGGVGLFASNLISITSPVLRVKREDILEKVKKYNVQSNLFYDPKQLSLYNAWMYGWHHFKYYIGWYSNRFRVIATILLIFWIGVGTLYVALKENWTFVTSLYWSITTASTGGLQSPSCIGDTAGTECNMGDSRGTLMGIFMFVAVPIYALAFGQYARMAIAKTIKYKELQLLNRPIEDAEFLFAANILSPEGSETLVLGEYILLELMRLGITNKRQIESMKNKFYELDTYDRGELDIDDLRREGKVVSRKKQVLLDI